MKLSAGVEWALHCCVVLTKTDAPVPSARLADLHGVSKTYLAKHLQALARAEIAQPSEGRDGGYVLMRRGHEVMVLAASAVSASGGPPAPGSVMKSGTANRGCVPA